jgi:hypothetical protein
VTTSRVSWRARRRLLGVAGVFCVLFLASCRAILGTDDYEDSVDILCGMLARCFDHDAVTCRTNVGFDLTFASYDDRTFWLKKFSDEACFDRCVSARRCLNTPPVCSFTACERREDCCFFVQGEKDCNLGNKSCCTRSGSRCSSDEDCCPGAGTCKNEVCGGVACGASGEACSIGAECCTKVCRNNVCADEICVPDGVPCSSDEECCLNVCNEATGTCGATSCAVETKACNADLPCCGDLVCRSGICSSPTCYSDGVECSADAQCCNKRCDPKLYTCRACSAAGAKCDVSGECCSGLCEDSVCSDCLPKGETCAQGGKSCCAGGECVDGMCVPKCGATGCGHDECETGEPMAPMCSPCIAEVCAQDPYCCCTAWDSLCVSEALSICTNPCG